jgi:hypothetical protein
MVCRRLPTEEKEFGLGLAQWQYLNFTSFVLTHKLQRVGNHSNMGADRQATGSPSVPGRAHLTGGPGRFPALRGHIRQG